VQHAVGMVRHHSSRVKANRFPRFDGNVLGRPLAGVDTEDGVADIKCVSLSKVAGGET
jgi:hypothetical protein